MQATTRSLGLIEIIQNDFKDRYHFMEGPHFVWSSADKTVYFTTNPDESDNAVWSLLHEIGHAELGHSYYDDDFDLLMMEVTAWQKAKELAAHYHLVIEQHHIEECLDSYRDWLHQRSRCVECQTHSLQTDETTYQCYNCDTKWKVPRSRRCVVRKKRIN